MLPRDLQAGKFAAYPPQARALATANLPVLQTLPLALLPALLRELIDYDFKFPEERASIERELSALRSLSPDQSRAWFEPFARLSLSPKLEHVDWVNHPSEFLEQESAWLWTTHQQDAFTAAATQYGDRLQNAVPPQPLPAPRLGIAVIGQGVATWDAPLFRNLRPHGTYFSQINPANGLDLLLKGIATRVTAHPAPFAHWYVDGGQPVDHPPALTCVSWAALEPVRAALLNYMQAQIRRPGMGPEQLRSELARLSPSELGMSSAGDPVLDRFQIKLFTEGSGTQIFSTTFAQWATREALRRAQPLTLLVRFAPRQRQRPMNELLSNSRTAPEVDPAGSLVDADMGAWYHWINQQRLAGADRSVFLAWFEGHQQALVIAPTLPRGAESASPLNLGQLLSLALT